VLNFYYRIFEYFEVEPLYMALMMLYYLVSINEQ